ncbi:MAG: VCBS repeat-containing protein [Phycisphaerales bacterium]
MKFHSQCACLLASAALTALCHAQPVYPLLPDWQSTDMQVSTGGALVDLNRDGWLDFVVANGNDIERQRLVVYYGVQAPNGSGTLQTTPSWQSADIAYHGHLDVADVDGDGWMDVAVAVLLAEGGPAAKLYRNVNGTLTANAVWTSELHGDTFGVSFGDMNADGRPDLALGAGQAYGQFGQTAYSNPVYLNVNGQLSATASWTTGSPIISMNCLWLDGDTDGWLDLWHAKANDDAVIYRNVNGMLEAQPLWRTDDSQNQFTLMAAWGDTNGDGARDLVIADNNQIFAGSGRFRRYLGSAAVMFETVASWTYFDGYTSAIAVGDVDRDGDNDLCTGEWFGRTRYFAVPANGVLPATPTWTNTGTATTTVEKLILGDIDRNGVRTRELQLAANDLPGSHRLITLPHQPIEDVLEVLVDDVALSTTQYTYSREQAWVSIGVTPSTNVRIRYRSSISLDLAVTNWDSNRPNQVYFNRKSPCDSIDFNNDTSLFDPQDIEAFLSVYSEGPCVPSAATCNDIDFNNDTSVFDPCDISSFLVMYSEGPCTLCGT